MTVFVKMYMSMRYFVFMTLKSCCCIILVYGGSSFLSYLLVSVILASKFDFFELPSTKPLTSCEFLL